MRCWHRISDMAGFCGLWRISVMHIGQGCAFGHCGGSVTFTNREIISLAGSTPTIDPATESLFPLLPPPPRLCPRDKMGGGGGGGCAAAIVNTSSLPSEQSSRSDTDPHIWLIRLRSLLPLSWLKYVDTVSTLGRLREPDFMLLVSESIIVLSPPPPRVLDRDRCMDTLRWWR